MDKENFVTLLLGKDRRTVKQNRVVIQSIHDQHTFDELFSLVFHHERTLVMRAIDAVEKVTALHPAFLRPHKGQLLQVLKSAEHKELKWHVAQLVPRTELTEDELREVWHIFTYWVLNKNESKIARVNALQALFDLSKGNPLLKDEFNKIILTLEHEMIPSLQTRIRKLKKTKT